MQPQGEGDGALVLPNVARPPLRTKQNIPEQVVKLDGSAEFSRATAASKAFNTASGTGTSLKGELLYCLIFRSSKQKKFLCILLYN